MDNTKQNKKNCNIKNYDNNNNNNNNNKNKEDENCWHR